MPAQLLRWLLLCVVLALLTSLLAYWAWEATDHWLTFPLDDSYIHLAIAKRIFDTGNWGVAPYQFQHSSSSPAYTLLLAFMGQLHEVRPWHSLLINGGCAMVWLWVSYSLLVPTHFHQAIKWGMTLGIAFLLPLPLLVLNGMEHMAHILAVTVFLREASRKLHDNAHPNGLLMLAALLMCCLRYESLFLIGAFVSLAVFYRRWRNAIFVLILGIMPPVLFGLISLSQGGTFLPLSILGKAHLPSTGWLDWLLHGVMQYYENPFMLVLLIVLLLALWIHRDQSSMYRYWNLMVLGAILAHVHLAEVGGYRYEAYLIGAGLIGILLTPTHFSLQKPATFWNRVNQAGLVAAFSFFFVLRAAFFTAQYPTFAQNIYHQHIQIARFVATYFPTSAIGVNDIGAISYYTEADITDFLGIGDQGVYLLLDRGQWDARHLQQLAETRDLEIAIVHPNWANRIFPDHWQVVGRLTIPNNQISAHESVLFYAVQPVQEENLRAALADFRPQLPAGLTLELFHAALPKSDSIPYLKPKEDR